MATITTQAEFARSHGLSRAYISQLVAAGRIPERPDGRLDSETAENALRNVRIHHRHRRSASPKPVAPVETEGAIRFCNICQQRHWVLPRFDCSVCDCNYAWSWALQKGSPDPLLFCSGKCAGLPEPHNPPPKPRICMQCGDPQGYSFDHARSCHSPDPSRFCEDDCAIDHDLGKTQAQTRYRLWIHWIEDGYTKKDLQEMGWGDWGGGRPWPKRKKARK